MAKNDTKIAVGVGLGMLAALSAGAYFLYGTKEGAKRRVKIKGWMLKAKGEILEKMENLKVVNEDTYNALVTGVMKKYQGLKNVDQGEVAEMVADLQKHWKNIKRHISEGAAKPKAKPKAKVKKLSAGDK